MGSVPSFRSPSTMAREEALQARHLIESSCSSSSFNMDWEGASFRRKSLAEASSPRLQGPSHGRQEATGSHALRGLPTVPTQSALRGGPSITQAISDPLTILLMYRRMLFQETNNGLMGGSPFISRQAHSDMPVSLPSDASGSLFRQIPPRKLPSSRNLGSLTSRS